MRRILKAIAATVALALASVSEMASADEVLEVEAVPTAWRLENYVAEHKVVLWFTGATGCINGNLNGTGMTQDDYNRLWSLILTAKASNRPVGVRYTADSLTCNIVSFYIQN